MNDVKTEHPTQLMVFLGSTWSGKGERIALLRRVSEDEVEFAPLAELRKSPEVERYGYKHVAKSSVTLRPGHVYRVKYPEGKQGQSIFTNTLTFVRPWPNAEEAARLLATEKANEAEWEALAMSQKGAKVDPLKESLKPVRDAYLGSIGVNRAQLLAWAVAYITGGIGE